MLITVGEESNGFPIDDHDATRRPLHKGASRVGKYFLMAEKSPTEPASPPPKNQMGRIVRVRRFLAAHAQFSQKRLSLLGLAAPFGVVLIIGACFWLLRPPQVAVIDIKTESVEVALAVVGRVRPQELVDVRSPNSGQIVLMLHDDGDLVAAGEPLAIVRSKVQQAQSEAGMARESAARAEVNRARLAFNRTQTLADRGIASAAASDDARASLQSAEAGLAAASADRRASEAVAGDFTIRAPIAGLILVRPIDNGQVVSPETTLFQLGSRDGVELQADVDEAYADALRSGMSARAALSGSDEVFAARITLVSPRVDPTTGGRLVKLAPVDKMNSPPGRSVDVTIVVDRQEDGIVVPRQAVLDATTEPKVYVVDGNDIVRVRLIEILDWPSLNAIIESGLSAGDRVVLAPTLTKPSERVRPVSRPRAPTPGK